LCEPFIVVLVVVGSEEALELHIWIKLTQNLLQQKQDLIDKGAHKDVIVLQFLKELVESSEFL
jgi:hypothetical protein